MSRTRLTATTTYLAIVAATLATAPPARVSAAPAGEALVLDLRRDPFGSPPHDPVLFEEGFGGMAFAFDAAREPVYPGDRRGALAVAYDAEAPSSRAIAPLGGIYTEADDFFFGAVLTVRGDGFHADPFGFHPITFALINSVTTGFDRTGDLTDFRSDTFDNVELAWFPQVSPIFGGPWLSPSAFGSPAGTPGDDAFSDFAFATSRLALEPDCPYVIVVEHRAAERILAVRIFTLAEGGLPLPLADGALEVDLSSLEGFAVDALAITVYQDGYNVFAPSGSSLRADVDYDRIFFGEGRIANAGTLRSILGRSRVGPGAGPSDPAGVRPRESFGGAGGRSSHLRDEDGPEAPRP